MRMRGACLLCQPTLLMLKKGGLSTLPIVACGSWRIPLMVQARQCGIFNQACTAGLRKSTDRHGMTEAMCLGSMEAQMMATMAQL